MVDIDRLAVQLATQVRRQDLHVAGKNHQFCTRLFDDLPDFGFLRGLVVGVQWEMVVRNAVPASQWLKIRVIGHHRDHVHGQLIDTLAIEQVIEAVIGFRDHDHDFWPVVGRSEFEDHAERFAALTQPGPESLFVESLRLTKLHTDEEASRETVIEGMVFCDVATLLEQKARHCVYRAQHAGAVGGQNPCVGRAAH